MRASDRESFRLGVLLSALIGVIVAVVMCLAFGVLRVQAW